MLRTGPKFELGEGLPVCILESDHRGASMIVQAEDGQNILCNLLRDEGGAQITTVEHKDISLIKARTLAKEVGKKLGW